MTTITLNIPNISCMHCVHTIQTEIAEIDGVESVNAWTDKKQATVTFHSPATEQIIRSTLTEINYPPTQ